MKLRLNKDPEICTECRLCDSTFVKPRGDVKSPLMLFGEAPGYDEERMKKNFVGRAGAVLAECLFDAGIEDNHSILDFYTREGAEFIDYENIFLDNIVRCRPPLNKLKAPEMKQCRPFWESSVLKVKPEVIVTLGGKATNVVLGGNVKISNVRGGVYDREIQGHKVKIIPTFHPSFVLHQGMNPDVRKVIVKDLNLARRVVQKGKVVVFKPESELDYTYCTTIKQIKRAYNTLKNSNLRIFGLDVETTDYGLLDNELLCIGISYKKDQCFVFPYNGYKMSNPFSDCSLRKGQRLVQKYIIKLMEDKSITWVAHNSSFDFGWLGVRWGIMVKGRVEDTMLEYSLIDETSPKDAKTLIDLNTDLGYYSCEVDPLRKKGFVNIPNKKLWFYNGGDTNGERRIHGVFLKKMEKARVIGLYQDLVKPINEVMVKATVKGFPVEIDGIQTMGRDYRTRIRKSKNKLWEIAGTDFNPNSPDQLRKVLFDDLKLPPIKFTPSELASTDKEVLAELEGTHPIIDELTQFRTMSKMYSTYIKGITRYLDAYGVVHPTFSISGAVTGRIPSREPALSTIPRGEIIRNLFVARRGYKVLHGDFSQAEYKWMAKLAGDEQLLADLASGWDIHDAACIILFGNKFIKLNRRKKKGRASTAELEEIKEMRILGKAFNFGLAYGAYARTMAERLGMSEWEVQEYLDKYFERYPKVYEFRENITNLARYKGELVTPFGRHRRFRGDWNKHVFNQALNFIPQSSVQDNTSMCVITFDNYLVKEKIDGWVSNMVYDSITAIVEEARVHEAESALRKICSAPIPELEGYQIPAEVGIGGSWAEAERLAA